MNSLSFLRWLAVMLLHYAEERQSMHVCSVRTNRETHEQNVIREGMNSGSPLRPHIRLTVECQRDRLFGTTDTETHDVTHFLNGRKRTE